MEDVTNRKVCNCIFVFWMGWLWTAQGKKESRAGLKKVNNSWVSIFEYLYGRIRSCVCGCEDTIVYITFGYHWGWHIDLGSLVMVLVNHRG